MATPPPPPVPPGGEKEEKSASFITMILIIIGVVGLITITVIGVLSLKRKYLGVEDRIVIVNSMIAQNEEMYSRLSNYDALEYTIKFNEYLTFLMDNVSQTRTDVRLIFRKKPKIKFKTNNVVLIGGRSKKEFVKNRKKKLYRFSDYKLFFGEASQYLEMRKVYKFKPHNKLGRKFSPTVALISKAEEFGSAKKEFSSSETDYRTFTGRLKEKKGIMKKLKKDYAYWKANPKAPPLPEVNPQTGEKNPQPMVSTDGKNEKQIRNAYKDIRNKLKLEIQELSNMRKHAYEKLKINKAKFKALDKAED